MTRMTRSLRAEGHQHPEWLLRSAERLFEVCLPSSGSFCLCGFFFELKSRQPRRRCRFIFSTDGRKRWQDDQPVTGTPKRMSGGLFQVSHSTEKNWIWVKKKKNKWESGWIYLFPFLGSDFCGAFLIFLFPRWFFCQSHLTLVCAWHPVTGSGSVWRIRNCSTCWLKANNVLVKSGEMRTETRAEFSAEDYKENQDGSW